MIFIKNKKAWKEFVISVKEDLSPPMPPNKYPVFVEITGCSWDSRERVFQYVCREDLEQMIQKIDSGREF